ncbi:4Fe-4S dicluster domain-containing protein [Desulfitobacterium sp.]|uniref:4Fe-4S dicluster domain-containing protein n=1 Tax=Desulfitobacterium sp. TaxID=49981 RepID=UPI002D7F4BBD|nr:4Fe-4S dicluster domain-containing protein [Desulfitobacterium sp.]
MFSVKYVPPIESSIRGGDPDDRKQPFGPLDGANSLNVGSCYEAVGFDPYALTIYEPLKGCHACTAACKVENGVPNGNFRIWVEEGEKEIVPNQMASLKLPRQCNQFRKAPCERVCPVGATYYSEDGVVLIDSKRCIGCSFCVAACPYDARFINPKTHSAEKCTFCYHRLEVGLLPACVSTCVGNARIFGDLNDPTSEVSKVLSEFSTDVLKPEMGTGPHVYYIGLDNTLSVTDYNKLSKKKG